MPSTVRVAQEQVAPADGVEEKLQVSNPSGCVVIREVEGRPGGSEDAEFFGKLDGFLGALFLRKTFVSVEKLEREERDRLFLLGRAVLASRLQSALRSIVRADHASLSQRSRPFAEQIGTHRQRGRDGLGRRGANVEIVHALRQAQLLVHGVRLSSRGHHLHDARRQRNREEATCIRIVLDDGRSLETVRRTRMREVHDRAESVVGARNRRDADTGYGRSLGEGGVTKADGEMM